MIVHVVHLTSVHPPLDIRIFHRQCTTLADAGYDVTLIAPCDSDYKVDKIKVLAIPPANNRAQRISCVVGILLKRALAENADIYHFHDPELIPLGIILKFMGKRVIYDVHEDLPRQILDKHWIPGILRRQLSIGAICAEWLAGLVFDHIVAATPTIANRFPNSKTITIQNFPTPEELLEWTRFIPYMEREPFVAYIGAIAYKRGALEMVHALGCIPTDYNCKLLLAGRFSPETLHDELATLPGWSRVDYSGLLDRKGIASLLGRARVGLVTLHPTQAYLDSYPIKLFEYMAAGIPVIASDFPLWRNIINGAECGLLVDPLNPAATAEAIQYLLDNPEEAFLMGKRGTDAVRTQYNWGSEARKLLDNYQSLSRR